MTQFKSYTTEITEHTCECMIKGILTLRCKDVNMYLHIQKKQENMASPIEIMESQAVTSKEGISKNHLTKNSKHLSIKFYLRCKKKKDN